MEFIELSTLIILMIVSFSAGFIDAVAGGGGMLTIPTLLSVGLPPHIALGTNKLAGTFASSTAAFTYFKKKLFNPIFWKDSFYSTLIGAIIGTILVNFISISWLEKGIPLVILASALYTLRRPQVNGDHDQLPKPTKKFKKQQMVQGITLGFYDGFFGPGTGAFWVVSSMSLYRLNILLASGIAKAMNFTSNITSLITFIIFGQINWMIGLTMGVCLMVGAFLGAHSAIRFGAKFIRPIFIIVVCLMAGKLAYEAWF